MIQYLYILQNDHHRSSHHPSPNIIMKFFCLVMRTFKIHSPNYYQICNTVLLTVVTMLYITSPRFIHFISGNLGTSLVVQWLRICLPMQGTRVRSLVQEDPTCHGATKPVHHNYWACTLEPVSHNYWAHVPQLLKPACLEPMLHNKRSHCNEKHVHHNEE